MNTPLLDARAAAGSPGITRLTLLVMLLVLVFSTSVRAATVLSESFEGSTGIFSQNSGDDLDWTLNSGSTPSSNTGPGSASEGSQYLYIEASGNGTGHPAKEALLTSSVIDLSTASSASFSFDYHMYGADMGTLEVQLSTDGSNFSATWNTSGNQSNNWHTATIDVSAYIGGDLYIRFRGLTGSDYASDISIDNFVLNSTDVAASGSGFEVTPAMSIPDNGCPAYTNITIPVSASETITDVNLGLNITHTYRADLQVQLTSPAGTTVSLLSGVGSSGDNFDILLDDESGTDIATMSSGTVQNIASPYYDSGYNPENSAVLADFNGENPSGNWVLGICDSANADTGTVNRVSLAFNDSSSGGAGSGGNTADNSGPRSFVERQTSEFKGNFEYVGNTLLHCTSGCTTNNHNASPMSYVDVDGDSSTFNSSSAEISLPADAQVTWAGLYWGGTAGISTSTWSHINPTPNLALKNQVKLKIPGGAYQTITAGVMDTISNSPTSGWSAYQAFADVTSIVQAAGAGMYTVADAQLDSGGGDNNTFTNPNGGWNLVVFYRSDAEKYRHMTIWDGYDFIYFSDADKSFNIDSIRTPPAGSFEAEVAFTCYDGELTDGSGSGDGDFVAINNTSQKLSNGLNPATNVCNGTISNNGNNVTTRNPADSQTWAFDVDRFSFNNGGVVPNDATSVEAIFGSDNEGIWFGNIVLSSELFTPPEISKSFLNSTTEANINNEMTITLSNPNGSGSLDGIAFSDNYPTGLRNAGSGVVKSNTCGGTLSAAADATSMSFSGGSLAAGASCAITLNVTGLSSAIGSTLTNCTSTVSSTSTDSLGASACAAVDITDATDRDYGDAPATYGDASHAITSNLYLGYTVPDSESGSQYSYNAYGDGDQVVDGAGTWYLSGDEDGAPSQPVIQHGTYIPLFPVLKMTAMSYSADFMVTNTSGSDATLFGWIDFDGNGSFDSDEAASVTVSDGSNESTVALSWSVPVDVALGTTFIRLRLTSDTSVTTSTPASAANDGEVEDFVLAVALDIPPDSPDVTVTSGETPLACQNIVFSDDFDDVTPVWGEFIGPNRGAGGGTVTALRDWTVSGGGADTYARVEDVSGLGMGSAVYLGNGAVRRISPAIGSGFTFDSEGRVTSTIDAIELRDAPDDSTPGVTMASSGTASHWGPEPVSLSRSFATEVGKTYRLYFKAIPEDQGGSFVPGVMRVDVPGGGVHFKIPGSNETTINYAIEFEAISTTSAISFVNYGHVNSGSGLGWCDPASEYNNNPWCTVGGGDANGNELIIDEILVAESHCGSGSISGFVFHDLDSDDNFDAATESGISAIAVSLFNDQGTAGDTSDDVLVASTSSGADGSYAFVDVASGQTYRIEVDASDPDLPAQFELSTLNPLSGIAVTSGSDTSDQNFGFEQVINSCPAGQVPVNQTGHAVTVILDQGVAYDQQALGAPVAEGTTTNSANAALVARDDSLILDLEELVPGQTTLMLSLGRNNSNGRLNIATSPDNSNYDTIGTYGNGGTLGNGSGNEDVTNYLTITVPAAGARYIRFIREAGGTWLDAVTYYAVCLADSEVGAISGAVYQDDNGNDTYDSGTESGLGAITVSLFDDANNTLITTAETDVNGDYAFTGLSPDKTYRLLVDSTDSSLPAGSSLGTSNPLTGVSVTAGNTTDEQNFGFDITPPVSFTMVGEYRFDDCDGNGSWNLDSSGNGNTATGTATIIENDFKDYGCTSVSNDSWNMEVPHHANYELDSGAVSILLYDHKNVWDDSRILEKGWNSTLLKLSALQVGDNQQGTVKAELNGNIIDTGEVYYTTQDDGSDNDTQWTHIMFTFGSQGMKLYVNGVLKGSHSHTGGIDQVPGNFKMPGLQGYFDEFYIFAGQPTDQQVQDTYTNLVANKNLDGSERACACKGGYNNNYCVVPDGATGLLDLGDMATSDISGSGSFAYPDRVLPGYGTVDITVDMSGGIHKASTSAIDNGSRQQSWLDEDLALSGPAIYLGPDSSGTASVIYDFDQPTGNVDLLVLDLDYEDTLTITAKDGDGNDITDFSGWRYRSGDMSVWQNPDPVDALAPDWDFTNATITSSDTGNDHRSFGLLTPDTLVTQIVVTYAVPAAAGRHTYTTLFTTDAGRDGEDGASCPALDFGDAPLSYGNASHTIVSGIHLGAMVPDSENATQATFNAMGDGFEEDGAPHSVAPRGPYETARFPVLKQTDTSYSSTFTVTNTTGSAGQLYGWIDFDKSGTFEADEAASVAVADGANTATVTLNWAAIPNDIAIGTTYIRLRLTTDSAITTATPDGAADNGEVEDFTIAVYQPVPTDSTSLTLINGETPQACQSVLFEDDFDDLNGFSWGANVPGTAAIRDWDRAGGGPDTYAGIKTFLGAQGSAVYFGNGAVRGISPDFLSGFTFDANGQLTSPIEAIALRDVPDDFNTSAGASQWGPEVVRLSRSFATEVGKTYRLYFKAIPEDGAFLPGVMRAEAPGGSIHFKAPGSSESIQNYAIEFTADATVSTIAFINYGHISGDWCNPQLQDWCTLGGVASGADLNELIVDDVVVTEADCGTGAISGTVYTDNNHNDSFDSGVEAGIGDITVTLLNDADGSIITTASTVADGSYSFPGLATGQSYRLVVDTTDPHLPVGSVIGTGNPLSGISVSAGSILTDQDFGFDVSGASGLTAIGEYRFDDCAGDGSWNIDSSANNNTAAGAASVISNDYKDYGCTSVQNSSWNMEVPHISAYETNSGAVSLLIYDHHNIWNDTRLLEKGWVDGTKLRISASPVGGDNTKGTISVDLKGNTIATNEIFYTTLNDSSDDDTQWTHVMLTFGSNGMKLYINGELKGSNSYTGGISDVPGNFKLPGMSGYFDEFYIFDQQVDAADVQTVYNNLLANKNLNGSTRACSCGGSLAAISGKVYIDENGNNQHDAVAGNAGSLQSDLLLLYRFGAGSGNTVYDISGVGSPMDLTIADPANVSWISGGGLSVDAATLLQSSVDTKLAPALKASDEITVEAWVKPDNLSQNGPARIATLSKDTVSRNMTLGQQNDDYNARLRTTTNSNNGTSPSTSATNSVATTLQHIVYTRIAGGAARIYVDGTLVASQTIDGDLSNLNDSYHFALANELTNNRPWLGEYYKVAVYQRALDATEVGDLFAEGAVSSEPLLADITVSLYNDNGTSSTTADDIFLESVSTTAGGTYQFDNVATGLSYRAEVDTTDADLPVGLSIGTPNPLTGITVTVDNTTADQNFGFDLSTGQPQFTCDANIYIASSTSESIPAQFHSVDTGTSPFTLDAIGNTAHGHSYNAMGYREQDDYIYAIRQASSNLLRIGADGSVIDLGAVSGLPVPANIFQTYDAGDVFPDGYLYIHEVTTHAELYKIDVTTTPPSLVETINLSQAIWLSDFAYNKIDDKVYGIGDQGEKFMLDPATWTVSTVGSNASPASYGAAYTDNQGNVYIYKNNPGTFYKVDFGLNGTGTGNMTELSTAPNVSFNDGASCRGAPPVAAGAILGTVYTDINANNSFDSGIESGIGSVTVSLLNDADGSGITTTSTAADGSYSFSGLDSVLTYRVVVDTADPDLPAGTSLGTTNPLTGITVAAGNTTTDQDFGFDILGATVTTTVGEYRFDDCGDAEWLRDYSIHGNTATGTKKAILNDGKDYACTSLSAYRSYVEVPHLPAYEMTEGAVSLLIYDHHSVWATARLLEKHETGGGDSFNLTMKNTIDSLHGTFSVDLNGNSIDTGETFFSVTGAGGDFDTDWVHIMFTFGPQGMRLYVDGQLKGTNAYTGGFNNLDSVFQLPYFSGFYDEFYILDGQPSDAQVQGLYNNLLANKNIDGSDRTCDCGSSSAAISGKVYIDENGNNQHDVLFSDGGSLQSDLLLLYRFGAGSGNTVYDISGVGSPINLTIADPAKVTWMPGGGLSVNDSTLLQSAADTKLTTALQTSNEVTMEAWVKPDNLSQTGPARIMTFSKDTGERNMTLGQQNSNYEVRLRTSTNDLNGSSPATTATGSVDTVLQHIVYTRTAAGVARIYVDGALVSSQTVDGDFSNLDSTHLFALANELTSDRPWLGKFYKVAVYQRALDATEVSDLFTEGATNSEPLLAGITVSLYDENGTNSTTADDIFLGSLSTTAGGAYQFSGLATGLSYRIEVDTADTDLSVDLSIGTPNPLAGVTVSAGSTTAEQNFGFDIAGSNGAAMCWAIDDDTANIYRFLPDISNPQPPVLIPTARANDGEGLSWRPSTNELYMWDGSTTYVMDAASGADVRNFTADLSPGAHVEGSAFYIDPVSKQEELWLIVEDDQIARRNDRYLIRIDPDTGVGISSVGPLTGGYLDATVDYGQDTGGLAIDPDTKQFWITNDGLHRGVYPLDEVTGVVGSGVLFNPSEVDGEALEFADDGLFYTESDEGPSNDRYIWQVNGATGAIVRAAGPFPGSGDVEAIACNSGASVAVAPVCSLIVTTTADSDSVDNNSGSLRDAIECANSNPGPDTITFNMPTSESGYEAGTGVWRITPDSEMPAVTDADTTIDASTQSGAQCDVGSRNLTVVLDGSSAGAVTAGLKVEAERTAIRGMAINSFSGTGIYFDADGGDVADGSSLSCSNIGTDAAGDTARANTSWGVRVNASDNVTIGGTDNSDRNIISGNHRSGILAENGDGLLIENNYIGVNQAGDAGIGNGTGTLWSQMGIDLWPDGAGDGSNNATIRNNVVSGNTAFGIRFDRSGNNTVQGNIIGLNATGTAAIPNGDSGIQIKQSANLVIGGSDVTERNIIAGNMNHGVGVNNAGSVDNIVILGNYFGVGADGATDLPNTHAAIGLYNATNITIGGSNAGEGNVINSQRYGVLAYGVDNGLIQGNTIGAIADQTAVRDFADAAIEIRNGSDNWTIGGSNAGAGNLIVGGANSAIGGGLVLDGTNGATVQGNRIGLLPNGSSGQNTNNIYILNSAQNIMVGGTGSNDGNVIAGATLHGMMINSSATPWTTVSVLGNSIFANADHGIDLGGNGVTVNDAADGDNGPNGLLNHPIIELAEQNGANVEVTYSLDVPAGNYHIEFFDNPSGVDPSGHGEGETLVGQQSISHTGTGEILFNFTLNGVTLSDVFNLAMTATEDLGSGNFGATSEFSGIDYEINGLVFEDLQYGGGNGRPFGTPGTVGSNDVRLEVYDAAGQLVTFGNSLNEEGQDGVYSLPLSSGGQYYVRAVSDSVASTRPGSDGSELGVMTFRTDGVTDVVNEVGGRNPVVSDAGLNDGSSTLNLTTFTFSGGALNGQQAQSVQPVTLGAGKLGGVSFGFNFNAIVNTNADGQGSLQQFAFNNNLLASTGITQQLPVGIATDYSAGDTVAVFMIPANQLNGSNEAVITNSSVLSIEAERTAIDGRMQSANTGSGTIIIQGDGSSLFSGIYFNELADGSVLRNVSINQFGGSGVDIYGAGSTSATGITLEAVSVYNNGQYGVLLQNGARHNVVIASIIAGNGWAGIANDADSLNTFSQNSIYDNGALGIDLGLDGVTENSGADSWLNYPEVSAGSSISSNGSMIVSYDFDLDVPANTHGYRIEFFSNNIIDPSGHGEGLTYLGYKDIESAGTGSENFKGSINANQVVPENANIAVTLTEKLGVATLGSTSEFSGVRNGNLSVCTDLLADPDAPLPTITIDENSTEITYLEAYDEDGNPVTYAISGGADANQFVINPVPPGALFDCLTIEFIEDDGVIGTRTQPLAVTRAGPPPPQPGNYEAPVDSGGDNTYDLIITATDVHGNQVTKPVSVTVQNVNEKPRITNAAEVDFVERQQGVVINLEAYDPDADDAEGSGISYSISGGVDARQFTLEPYSGELRFTNIPDFGSPADKNADNVYELTVRVADDQGYASSKDLMISVTDDPNLNGVALRASAFLQGAYVMETGLMQDMLRTAGVLPVPQPYASEPFNHNGTEQINLDLALVTGNDAIVDWVLLELRAVSDPGLVLASKAGLVQRDGDIVEAGTGSADLIFPTTAGGQYYISLRHRNHLGVITAVPVAVSGDASAAMVDFSQPATTVMGEYARLQVAANESGDEVTLLWSGDVNQDQRLVANGEGSDLNPILSAVLTAPGNNTYNSSYQFSGYHASDLNMDAVTLFMGPGNDANVLLGNILLHPANDSFLSNFVSAGALQ